MAEPLTHINYSFEDIQRYLQGKMSAAEMHAIEKAALQDPFLADAIEGFNEADLTKAQQHLNEINTSLFLKKQKTKVVAFNKKTQWLNIAAIIIVLAGIGVVASYFLKSSNQQNQIAQVKKETVNNNVTKDSSVQTLNTPATQDTALFIAQNKLKRNAELSTKRKVVTNKSSERKNISDENITQASVAGIAAAPAQENKSSNSSSGYSNLSSKNNDSIQASAVEAFSQHSVILKTFSGKIVDQNNDPVPFATISLNDKQQVAADATGKFTITNNDSVLHVTISAIGLKDQTAYIKPGMNDSIKLYRNDMALNEVVVTALGTSKKRKPSPDSAMPVGGWQNFNNYILTKLNKDSTENTMNPDDLVELEFLIDDNGNPYNIKVTKPLDEERNAKAIDILKNGPRWTKTAKKKKAKVSISF